MQLCIWVSSPSYNDADNDGDDNNDDDDDEDNDDNDNDDNDEEILTTISLVCRSR